MDNLVIVFNLISQGPLSFDDSMCQKDKHRNMIMNRLFMAIEVLLLLAIID